MSGARRRDTVPACATVLGRAGLLPFCAAPVLLYVDPTHRGVYTEWLAGYGLAILCFLAGIWWGLALIRRAPWVLVASNVMVLVAVFGYLGLGGREFLLLCVALFPITVLVERCGRIFRAQPPYYARLRLALSGVAAICLLLTAALDYMGQSAASTT